MTIINTTMELSLNNCDSISNYISASSTDPVLVNKLSLTSDNVAVLTKKLSETERQFKRYMWTHSRYK